MSKPNMFSARCYSCMRPLKDQSREGREARRQPEGYYLHESCRKYLEARGLLEVVAVLPLTLTRHKRRA